MTESERVKMLNRKRPPVVIFVILFAIPLWMGLFGFYRVTQGPQFEAYRTVDVVQLLGSGACFGAALTGLIVILLRPRVGHNLYRSAELDANVKKN